MGLKAEVGKRLQEEGKSQGGSASAILRALGSGVNPAAVDSCNKRSAAYASPLRAILTYCAPGCCGAQANGFATIKPVKAE